MAENTDYKSEAIGRYKEILKSGVDPEAVRKYYAGWAKTYDQDSKSFSEPRSRFARSITEELFSGDTSIKILDAGAGTGQVGEALKSAGYTNIDALDASPEMLEIAKSKRIYKNIFCEFLGPKKLQIEEGTYDYIICMGSLLGSHINQDAFGEMLRITKPGGYIAFIVGVESIGAERERIEGCMKSLEDTGKWEWKVNKLLDEYYKPNNPEDSSKGLQYVFRKPL